MHIEPWINLAINYISFDEWFIGDRGPLEHGMSRWTLPKSPVLSFKDNDNYTLSLLFNMPTMHLEAIDLYKVNKA